jgi:GntR family transcriptional regulator, transcriptional repressor for pyruvate dehydrogenase complex
VNLRELRQLHRTPSRPAGPVFPGLDSVTRENHPHSTNDLHFKKFDCSVIGLTTLQSSVRLTAIQTDRSRQVLLEHPIEMSAEVETTQLPVRLPFEIIPIEKVDIRDAVLDRLTGLINTSDLKPGDRLPSERELVGALHVSRATIREALRTLESMGKIEVRRNAGSFIVDAAADPISTELKAIHPIDIRFLSYLVDVRAALEDRVVILAATDPRIDLSGAREALAMAEQELTSDRHDRGSFDLRFEAALGRAGGNPLLLELQRSIHTLWVEAWNKCQIAPGDQRRLHSEHVEILAAIEQRDVARARTLMADHVDRTVEDWHDARELSSVETVATTPGG